MKPPAREYGLLLASAFVSAWTNLLGLPFRGRSPRRILVLKIDHLGDAITAVPALRALRDAHPEAVIDLVLNPSVAPLFRGTPLADRVLEYDSPLFRRDPPRSEDDGDIVAERYDTIVELRGDGKTLALPRRTRAVRRVDRGTVRLADWIGRRLLGSRRPPLHEVETNLAIVRPLLAAGALLAGARAAAPQAPEILVAAEADRSMRAAVGSAGLDASAPFITMHPGAAWRPRAWRAERFAALADRLAVSHGLPVAVVGLASEHDIERAMRAAVREARVAWLFGVLSLPEIAALLRASRLFIGNDSGLAHLAAACGTPVVALFGPQDPRRFAPRDPRVSTLHHRVPCFPCDQTVCVRPELPCVNLIEVAEVEAAARATLG